MAFSEVEVCNLALGLIDEKLIRSFDENNRRARKCQIFYEAARDKLLSSTDWNFARRFVKLQQLDSDDYVIPAGMHIFQLPVNCLTPRDVYPRGSRQRWETQGKTLLTSVNPVYLYYTAKVTDVSLFTSGFVDALSYEIALKLNRDKERTRGLKADWRESIVNAQEQNANANCEYRHPDTDPDQDTFVNNTAASIGVISEDL